ncbi:hypothetical protein Tco_0619209 [Tanacetum coccineum]
MADDQPMWGNNRAVATTHGSAIVAVDLGENFTVKGHHISMIKDCQFDGRARADQHKHITEFIGICGMIRYGNTNVDIIKLKLFPSSLSGDANVLFNELSPGIITTLEQMRQAFVSRFFPPAMFDRLMGEMLGLKDFLVLLKLLLLVTKLLLLVMFSAADEELKKIFYVVSTASTKVTTASVSYYC